ncbi:hypothetical protein LCGC14_0499080 [marine sediment metagenome]|uniref:Uncharacterized protein n=1 Tax=marine sediment metagenome TaxID=412755 RepID=A0A0F9S9H0_9ZZZZ
MLALEDLAGADETLVRDHIVCEFEIEEKELDGFEVLIAYESCGSWGCDSSNWFLLRKDGQLYENHGSHCSCNGFEEQWAPEETSVDYLLSEKFYFPSGGYDTNGNEEAVSREIRRFFTVTEATGRRAAIAAQKARAANPYIETEE